MSKGDERKAGLIAAHREGLFDGASAIVESLEALRISPGVPGSSVEGFNLAIDCARSALRGYTGSASAEG